MSREAFGRFIGIDLGGGRGKNTAVARLEVTGDGSGPPRLGVVEAKVRYGQRGTGSGDEPSGESVFRDAVLVDYLERWVDEQTVVAINAPLTLPPCVRCDLPCPGFGACEVESVRWMREWAPRLSSRGRSDPHKPSVTPYTQRATEILWAAAGVRPRETLGQGTGPLAARASYLRRHLFPTLRLNENLIEVHPRATLARLFGAPAERRARRGETSGVWAERKRLLAEGLQFDYVWPEVVVRNTHVFYAVMGAYTGFLWSRRGWQGPADLAEAGGGQGVRPGLADAAAAMGDTWIEDGWIWAPPENPAGCASD